MDLELSEAMYIEILTVHRILASRTQKRVEVDLTCMTICDFEQVGIITLIGVLLDPDVISDLLLMRRVIRSGLIRLCSR